MSADDDARTRAQAAYLEEGLASLEDEDAAAIDAMTPEQVRAELARAGVDVEKLHAKWRAMLDVQPEAAPALTAAQGGSNVTSLGAARARRLWRVLPPLALAALVLLFVGASFRREIAQQVEAWLGPAPTAPPPEPTTPKLVPELHEPTPHERADALRAQAYVNIDKGYLGDAMDQLDEAQRLDIEGESQEVHAARDRIRSLLRSRHGSYAKGPIAPGERPINPR